MQSFRIIKPAAALVPYVRHYWVLSDDALAPVSERTLPVGCVQMVFHRGRQLLSLTEGRLQPSSFISGQAFGYSDVESTGMLEMIVVVFQPFAAKAFLHIPVSEFRGMNVNTEETDDPQLVDLGRRVADMPDQAACIRLFIAEMQENLALELRGLLRQHACRTCMNANGIRNGVLKCCHDENSFFSSLKWWIAARNAAATCGSCP